MRRELLEVLKRNNVVYKGYGALLIPSSISHVLRICLIAGNEYRIRNVIKKLDVDEKEAKRIIKRDDEIFYHWSIYIHQKKPTDKSLYDMVLKIDEHNQDELEDNIMINVHKEVLRTTTESLGTLDNEIIATDIKIYLLENDYNVDVAFDGEKVEIYIKKFVLRLEKYKNDLRELILGKFKYDNIKFIISKSYKSPSIIRNIDLEIPQKVLLVDDEIEFVETLSERLKSRSMNPSIAYNGEDALEQIEKEAPEVMILDLKMPGIDGMKVLEQVKSKHPSTEVIILTGHGSDFERKRAMELGAFAYLEKPVDINVLSETMKQAYKKVQMSKD